MRRGRLLTLRWADKHTFEKTLNTAPDKFFTIGNIFQQLQDATFTTPSKFSFLIPPDYCKDEVNAVIDRYRMWRIKSVKLYLRQFMITSTIAAQATAGSNGKTKLGVLYHYNPATEPSNNIDDVYIYWHSLPLRKGIKFQWQARMKGWFDQKLDKQEVVIHGGVTTEVRGYTRDLIQAYTSENWQASGDLQDDIESRGCIAKINGMRFADTLSTYLPTNVYNPMITNFKMVVPYLVIQPDFAFTATDNLKIQYKIYQYVTLEFLDNTEIWK